MLAATGVLGDPPLLIVKELMTRVILSSLCGVKDLRVGELTIDSHFDNEMQCHVSRPCDS
jgi:hypothetical protein